MPYSKQTWVDGSPSTPLSAARLGHLESGVKAASDAADAARAEVEGRLSEANLNATIGAAVGALSGVLVPLARYLSPGQAMPNDGAANAQPLVYNALRDLTAKADANAFGARFYLTLPAGVFRITSDITLGGGGRTTTVPRVGVLGAGMSETIIKADGNVCAFVFSSPGPDVPAATGHHFRDFTVDLTDSTHPDPTGSRNKAFKGRGFVDCLFENITVLNSPATAIGTDFPVRTTFFNVHVKTTGNGAKGEDTIYDPNVGPLTAALSTSGFGIGFGVFPDESLTLINCTASDCQRAGFFWELFDFGNGYTDRSAVINMIGCRSYKNRIGMTNAGAGGVNAVNCDFEDNTVAGLYGGVSQWVTAYGSRGDVFTNCNVRRNPVGLYATGDYSTSKNYNTLRSVLGGYRIVGGSWSENTGPAILAERFETIEAGGLTVDGVDFARNGGPAIVLRRANLTCRDVRIRRNYFDGNAGAAMRLLVPMNAPELNDNTFVNSDGVNRQTKGIEFHAAEPVTSPMVQRNTFRRITTPLVNAARLEQAGIKDNRVLTSASGDPDEPRLYFEKLYGGTGSAWPTAPGWLSAGSSASWNTADRGARFVGDPATAPVSYKYRDLGTGGSFVQSAITSPIAPGTLTQFIGVFLGASMGTASARCAVVLGVNEAYTEAGASNFYALWKVVNNTTWTKVWESTVPRDERRVVALGRKAGSTVTDVYIDDELVHSVDIPDVPAGTQGGVVSKSASGQSRYVGDFRAMTYGSSPTPPPPSIPDFHSETLSATAAGPWPDTDTGWLSGGSSAAWARGSSGSRHNGVPETTPVSYKYRDVGASGVRVQSTISAPTAPGTVSQFIGVLLGSGMDAPATRAVVAFGVNEGYADVGASNFYALWKLAGGAWTKVWESTVPRDERHTVGLAREVGSTVTRVYIDDVLVHTLDVTDVPATGQVGVFAKPVADQSRYLTGLFRAIPHP